MASCLFDSLVWPSCSAILFEREKIQQLNNKHKGKILGAFKYLQCISHREVQLKEIQLLQGSDDVIFPKQRRGSVCVALHRQLVYLLFNRKKHLFIKRTTGKWNGNYIKLTVRTQEIFIEAYFSHWRRWRGSVFPFQRLLKLRLPLAAIQFPAKTLIQFHRTAPTIAVASLSINLWGKAMR